MKQRLSWRRPVPILALLAALPIVGLAWAGTSYTLNNGTVASGGSVTASECFSLIATIGEPVAGTVSNGEYQLTSGFPATVGDKRVATGTAQLFKDSFEGNSTGGCTP